VQQNKILSDHLYLKKEISTLNVSAAMGRDKSKILYFKPIAKFISFN